MQADRAPLPRTGRYRPVPQIAARPEPLRIGTVRVVTALVGNVPYRHTHDVQQQRRRTELFVLPDRPCGLCGNGEAVVTQSRTVRQGLAWVNPLWSPEVDIYELCSACGAKRSLESSLVA